MMSGTGDRPALRRLAPAAAAAVFSLFSLRAARAGSAPGEEIYAAHNQIAVIDAAGRKIAAEIPIDEVVNGIAFSKDGSRAFIGTSGAQDPKASQGGLYILDRDSRKVLSKASENPVKELRVHPGGKHLDVLEWRVRAEERGGKKRPVKEQFHLRTFDISGGEPKGLRAAAAGMNLYDFAVSGDRKTAYLLDPGHNELRLLDLEKGTFLEVADLASGSKADGTYLEAAPAKIVLDRKGEKAGILLNGSSRTGLLLIDLDARTRRILVIQSGSALRAGAFAPDGKRVLLLALQRLLVLDMTDGKLLKTVPLRETFTSIALSADGSEIFLGAPVVMKTKDALGGGLVEVRDGESYEGLTKIPIPITVKFIAMAPPRKPVER